MRKKLVWIFGLALVLALVGGGGYYYYKNVYLQAQEPVEEATIATYTVERGDLVITATGAGTLVPSAEVEVAFGSSGVLAELLVAVGDKVDVGQVLARLDDLDAQDAVAQAEIALRQAELELAALTGTAGAADLAAAQSSLSSAKAELAALTSPPDDQEVLAARQTLKSAKDALADLLALPDEDEVEIAKADMTSAEMAVRTAQAAYDQIAWRAGSGTSQEAADLWTATTDYERAKATYEESLEGATADDLADARAQIALAQAELNALLEDPDPDEVAAAEAKVAQTQAELDDVLAGASAADLEAAQLSVDQARLELATARRGLDDTELIAPIAGTVIAVAADVGEAVGTEALITLADLEQPQVEFWVEETDLVNVAPGNAVTIVFEALPDYSFNGQVLSVDPVLVEVDSTPAVQSYASLDLSAHPVTLLSGMNAEVEVVAGQALDAVLVPLEALRKIDEDQFGVFVVQSNGELEFRTVEVGLKDLINAEIRSGLDAGEVVSLGSETITETSTDSESSGGDQPPGPGMMPFPGG